MLRRAAVVFTSRFVCETNIPMLRVWAWQYVFPSGEGFD
jgi:hypothetical protein